MICPLDPLINILWWVLWLHVVYTFQQAYVFEPFNPILSIFHGNSGTSTLLSMGYYFLQTSMSHPLSEFA